MARLGRDLEEIDLSDRRGLIAMAEIYAGNTAAYNNNGFASDDGTVVNFVRGRSNKEDITNILHNTGIDQSAPHPDKLVDTASPRMATVSTENGTSSKYVPPRKKVVTFTYPVLVLLVCAMIAALALAVFLSFLAFRPGHGFLPGVSPGGLPNDSNLDPSTSTPEPLPDDASEEASNGPTPEELRLPSDLEPLWYNLSMRVYVPGFVDLPKEKELTFSAALIIKMFVRKATNVIELNSLHLDLPSDLDEYAILVEGLNAPPQVETPDEGPDNGTSELRRKRQSGVRSVSGIRVTKVTVKEDLEKVVFELDKSLEEGKEYYFQFRYAGPIAAKLAGLYQTTYTDPEGKLHYAAVSQMEPTDARRMVPCFDEPAFKAIWRLKIYHPKGSRAVSNAIETEENELDAKMPEFVYTTFEETPSMSSYLLAVVVCEFEFIEGFTKRNTRFRIWSRKEAINETQFALYAGIKVLEFYEDYYGINFPLQKQDMMALPDFAAGAMENWGLVTYRERTLLYNPNLYGFTSRQRVASVVAHELAHQWFGNLVTMKWWNDLWLNEGFATLVEHAGVDAIDPHYKMDDYFIVDAMNNAFTRDAMATSHPLSFEIAKAEDVSEAFDIISYDKGATVLRMIRSVLGEESFKKGLHIYLKRFSYKNAEHEDLLTALTEAVPDDLKRWDNSRFDVNDFAKAWTEQMGYPVISVTTSDAGLVLNQNRFKINNNSQESRKYRNPKFWYKWDVPIWYTVEGESQPMTWLHSEVELNLTNPDALVFVNSESNGFYRVKYDQEQMAKINKRLLQDPNSIKMRSRARYVSDCFTLAQAGLIPYQDVLEMSRYLVKEDDFAPLDMAVNGLHMIAGYFGDEPEAADLTAYMMHLFQDKYEQVKDRAFGPNGSDPGTADTAHFYAQSIEKLIVTTVCELKNKDCVRRALASYQQQFVLPCGNDASLMSSQCSRVPVSYRHLIYCNGIKYGNEEDWERMLSLFNKESVQVERDSLMVALTCSRDTYTLKRFLRMAANINDTVIRLQDKAHVVNGIGGTHIGSPLAFEFFVKNWSQLYKDLKDQQTLLKAFVSYSLSGKSMDKVKQIKEFMAANKETTGKLDIFKQRLEVIETNAQWMDRNFRQLADWFKLQNAKIAATAASS